MSDWISVEDRLPESGAWYLASSNTSPVYTEILFFGVNEHGIHWLKEGAWEFLVTHWMEIPELPPVKIKSEPYTDNMEVIPIAQS